MTLAPGKIPGLDGFNNEFYKFFLEGVQDKFFFSDVNYFFQKSSFA